MADTRILDEASAVVTWISLANGKGMPVVVLSDSAVKGIVVEGQNVNTQPVTIGGRVSTSLATRTLMLDGQAQQAVLAADGRLVVLPFTSPDAVVATTPIALTTTGDVQLVAAGASGVKLATVGFMIDNVSATDTSLIIKDGSTIRARIAVPKRGGGVPPIALSAPIIGTAATALNGALSDAATTVYVTPITYRTQV